MYKYKATYFKNGRKIRSEKFAEDCVIDNMLNPAALRAQERLKERLRELGGNEVHIVSAPWVRHDNVDFWIEIKQ